MGGKVCVTATFGLYLLSPANANLLLDRQVNAIVGVDAVEFRTKRTCRLRGERRLAISDPSEDLFKSGQPGSKIGHRRLQRGHAIEERFVGGVVHSSSRCSSGRRC